MLDIIWVLMIIISIIFAIITGNAQELSNSVMTSANDAVELIIGMTGIMCFWSGLMEIAQCSGLTKRVAKLLEPVVGGLFPKLDKSGAAFSYICANITANLLGIGNAATPLGIKAMQELHKESDLAKKGIADRNMIMLVILNTTSVQLMPTMIISLLSAGGSSEPAKIVPAVWGASISGLAAGVIAVKLFYRRGRE